MNTLKSYLLVGRLVMHADLFKQFLFVALCYSKKIIQ